MREINSITNETITKYRKLKDKKFRIEENLYIVEGLRMVSDAVALNQNIKALFIDKAKFDKFESLAGKIEGAAEVFLVSEKVLNSLSDTVNSQGIIAALELKKREIKPPENNVLILDGISDPGNLGTIIRTAAAFNYLDIYLAGCADIYSPKVIRSTMSGIFLVNVYEADSGEIIEVLKKENYKIVCADLNGEDISGFKASGRFALVIGSEANGIRKEFIQACDSIITIAMRENVESLNAAVSAAIIMHKLK